MWYVIIDGNYENAKEFKTNKEAFEFYKEVKNHRNLYRVNRFVEMKNVKAKNEGKGIMFFRGYYEFKFNNTTKTTEKVNDYVYR